MIRVFFIVSLFSFGLFCEANAQFSIKGKVIDAETKEPIPFVSVVIVNSQKGCSTDMDGNFKLNYPQKIKSIKLSSIGYETKENNISFSKKNLCEIIISLKKTGLALNEVKVVNMENPALRIIENASNNRPKNNPRYISKYSCKTYTKGICDLIPSKDPIPPKTKLTLLEKMAQKLRSISDSKHFLITESVTEKKYKSLDFVSEKVLGTKISGLSEPSFSILPSTAQPFGFYDDEIKVLDERYVNPLIQGSSKLYFFNIEDTIYHHQDTIFVIAFRPKKKKNFAGLKGTLHINTSDFAIQKVVFSPAIDGILVRVAFEQEYEKNNQQQWFPSHFKYEYTYFKYPSKYLGMKLFGETFFSEIILNDTKVLDNNFSHQQVSIIEEASQKDENFWKTFRKDTLSKDEQRTYYQMDSIGKTYHLDQKLKLLHSLVLFQYPTKYLDLDLKKFADLNLYEIARVGIGVHSNQSLSKWVTIGGYGAWGIRDKKFKYGLDLNFLLNKKYELELNLAHCKDVFEPANSKYFYAKTPMFQDWSIARMDFVHRNEIKISSRLFEYLTSKISLRVENRQPLYNYDFINNHLSQYNNFQNTELRIQGRWAYKERIISSLNKKISKGTNYPVFNFAFIKSLKIKHLGDYNYTKYSLSLEKKIRFSTWGESYFCIETGLVNGNAPYFALLNGEGSWLPKQFLLVKNTFQTMPLYDYLSDKYTAIYFQHNFKNLLHRFESVYCAPQPVIFVNYAIGSLSNPQNHSGIIFKTLEKGYWEFGGVVNNVFKINYLDMVFLGLGGGVFYHPFDEPSPIVFEKKRERNHNITAKVSFTLAFN